MNMNRVVAVAAGLWCAVALMESTRSPSYAQGSAGSPELPYNGLATTPGSAFHVINASDAPADIAVRGSGPTGVFGASSVGNGTGVIGEAAGDFGVGVIGSGRAFGVLGVSEGYAGVVGRFRSLAEENIGGVAKGESVTFNQGILGVPNSGVVGLATVDGGRGVMGVFSEEIVENVSEASTATGINRGLLGTQQSGVQGESESQGGFGVAGKAIGGPNAVAVYGQGSEGFAGFFRGRVTITEGLLVHEINAERLFAAQGLVGGAKLFKIDHPLDPANKFLSHGSVESTQLKNLYDGIATFDERGMAEVVLPDWFESLNGDFRYQLTPVGGYSPLYIACEIRNGRFTIAGGKPGLKVSWQVTGARQDAYAKAHPVVVEEAKSQAERGRYLHPVELGLPKSLAISHSDTSRVDSFEKHRASTVPAQQRAAR